MASPKIEKGHIDIANEIADKLCSYRLSGQEWQVLWVIIRKTWGWLENPGDKNSRKKKEDIIALSQFSQLTGIDRRKCHVILKKLVDKKVIKKTVTQKGDNSVIKYGIQKDFDKWKLSPKKVTVTQKGDGVSPKKATKLSPKKTPTKETTKKTITKESNIVDSDESTTEKAEVYYTYKKRKLSGRRLESFKRFWSAFDYKDGKAKAADAWLNIPSLTDKFVDEIVSAAKAEAQRRPGMIEKGKTPKMAQGWITEKRWEDETYKKQTESYYDPPLTSEQIDEKVT